MRFFLLSISLVLLSSVGAEAAIIKGKVVSRTPNEPLARLDNFRLSITKGFQPGGRTLGIFPTTVPGGLTLDPKGATEVPFSLDVGTLSLDTAVEVTLTFTAGADRVPAVLQVAGNQNLELVIVLPFARDMPDYQPSPPATHCISCSTQPGTWPAPPHACEPIWTPKKRSSVFNRFLCR